MRKVWFAVTTSSVVAVVAVAVPAQSATPTCAGKPATIVGTGWEIYGTQGPDVIVGTSGENKILAGGGNDLICAGDGYDIIWSGDGNDRVYGQGGNDEFEEANSEVGRDTFYGGAGRDVLWQAVGADTFFGGGGNDFMSNDDLAYANKYAGESGDDRIEANEGGPADTVNGGLGRDTCAVDRNDLVASC